MEQDLIIHIGLYKMLGIVATIVGGAWYTSSRLTKVETKVDIFEGRLTNFEGRLDNIFKGASPVALQPKGVEILEKSGLKKYIDDQRESLLDKCRSKTALTNPYDMQSASFRLFDTIEFGKFEEKLKEAAFRYGTSMETVRRIGGIYFRDICLEEHGFKPEDLDG